MGRVVLKEVDLSKMADSYKRVSRNLYASKRGYMVRYWTKKDGIIEERFDTFDDVKKKYS